MLGQRLPFIVKILLTALGVFLFSQNYILITSVSTVGGTEEDMAISELAATGTIVESNVTTATATIAGSNATTVWSKPQQDELLCAENGPEGTVGREMLTQHLKVTSVDTKRSPRIFCAIYTYPGGINQSTAYERHGELAVMDIWQSPPTLITLQTPYTCIMRGSQAPVPLSGTRSRLCFNICTNWTATTFFISVGTTPT